MSSEHQYEKRIRRRGSFIDAEVHRNGREIASNFFTITLYFPESEKKRAKAAHTWADGVIASCKQYEV